MRTTIIRAHNRARSITKPSASDMLRMTWDNALAKTAVDYTRKCIYEHNAVCIVDMKLLSTIYHDCYLYSQDRTNSRFGYIGENIFISTGIAFNAKLLDYAVKAWDQEKTVYNYNADSCRKGKMCGHYTQV